MFEICNLAEQPSSRSSPSRTNWTGTWRSTYLNIPRARTTHIDCSHVFSDILYRPFLCAYTSLKSYTCEIPVGNRIPRRSDIPLREYINEWTNKPFILTLPVLAWPVYRDWSINSMLEKCGDIVFRAEAVDWPLKSYVDYMNDNSDESPLYLFDRLFVEKMALEVGTSGHYWGPECFGKDLFHVLDNQRPDSRWLIIGPERSGSTFHKDPNATRWVFGCLLCHFLLLSQYIVLGMPF